MIHKLEKNENKIISKINHKNINMKFSQFVVNDSYSKGIIDNTFCIFKSIYDILYLIYINENKSIVSFDLINNRIINEIKAYQYNIECMRYYLDSVNKRDLIITISSLKNDIQIWDIKNFECLLFIKNINKSGYIYSSFLLFDNNQEYIITSNVNYKSNPEPIKIYDFNGNKIKEINNSKENTYFIDIYYDKKSSKTYIVTCNDNFSKSYDYKENKVYKIYYEFEKNNRIIPHISLILLRDSKKLKLIESSNNGYIRVWNFHSCELIKKIKVGKESYDICLWDKDCLFVGGYKLIYLIDLKNGETIKILEGHNQEINSIKKIIHPKFGEVLISQGIKNIILWSN